MIQNLDKFTSLAIIITWLEETTNIRCFVQGFRIKGSCTLKYNQLFAYACTTTGILEIINRCRNGNSNKKYIYFLSVLCFFMHIEYTWVRVWCLFLNLMCIKYNKENQHCKAEVVVNEKDYYMLHVFLLP